MVQIINEKNFVTLSLVLLVCMAISYAVHFDCYIVTDLAEGFDQYNNCPTLDTNIFVSLIGSIAALVYFLGSIVWVIFTIILSFRQFSNCCKIIPKEELMIEKKQVKKKSVKRK